MKLSFVIPAYNAAKTVSRCLDSVIAQTDSDWEVVVIDDGSKDNTYEVIQSYAQKDSRIISLTQENKGPGITRNNAIEHTTGDYIAFLDSDDYIEPKYIELVKEKLVKDKLDVVILDNYYEKSNGELIRLENLSRFEGLDKESLIAVQMTGKMPWGGWRKVIKADIIKENEIKYSHDAVGEEAIFSFQVFSHASKIGFLGIPVLHYVDYPTSQSKKGEQDPWGDVVENLKKHLIENGLLRKYEKQLNSFAVTALTVALFRISTQNPFGYAVKMCRLKTREFLQKYPLDFDESCLETRVKLILMFVKIRFMSGVVLISKIKQLLDLSKK